MLVRMSTQARKDLQAIVDRLGPDVWLALDRAAFPRYFGRAPDAIATAEAFFRRNRCVCFFENRTTEPTVRFRRP
jgi:hypothetical protein